MTPSPNNTWFPTRSGIRFELEAPTADMIRWPDIAWSLANQCRFNGHTKQFYSVAEHSLGVARLLPMPLQTYGLLHDAHEAYVGDLVQPLKDILFKDPALGALWKRIEHGIDRAVYAKAELPMPTAEEAAQVKTADLRMLRTERRQLFPDHTEPWAIDNTDYQEATFKVGLLSPAQAAQAWLDALAFKIPTVPYNS